MRIYVSFSDDTEAKIIASFSCPQDPEVRLNQGTVDTSDPRWTECYSSTSPFLTGGMPSSPAN